LHRHCERSEDYSKNPSINDASISRGLGGSIDDTGHIPERHHPARRYDSPIRRAHAAD
jgi:hypothetical protein